MTRAPLLLLGLFWAASIVVAFIAGRSGRQNYTSKLPLTEFASSSISHAEGISTEAPTQHLPDKTDSQNEPIASASLSLNDMDQLTPAKLGALLETAFAMPVSEPDRAQVIEDVLKQLASAHPQDALNMADGIESLRDRSTAKVAILEVWGQSEPDAAMQWALSNSVDAPQRALTKQLQAVMRGYAQTDPTGAFAMAYGMSSTTSADERLRSRVMASVIEAQVRNGGVDRARGAIQALDDGATKDRLVRELVEEWAAYDPASAASYVSTLGETASTEVKNALIVEWAESNPIAAAAWLDSTDPQEPGFGRATASIIQEWTQYDLNASAEWLNSLPASPELDWAVASYTYRAAHEDPSSAMSWAQSVNNERIQRRLVQRVAASWKVDDPQSFELFLEASDYSEEEKEAMRAAENSSTGWSRRSGRQ